MGFCMSWRLRNAKLSLCSQIDSIHWGPYSVPAWVGVGLKTLRIAEICLGRTWCLRRVV